MSISRIVVAITVGFVLAQGTATALEPGCAEKARKTHRLKFKVKADECVEQVLWNDDTDADKPDKDAEVIHVCEGDTVVWKVNGSKKSVMFKTVSPLEWGGSGFEGKKIEGTVQKGTAGQEYSYSVTVKGKSCVHDPRMIVDNN